MSQASAPQSSSVRRRFFILLGVLATIVLLQIIFRVTQCNILTPLLGGRFTSFLVLDAISLSTISWGPTYLREGITRANWQFYIQYLIIPAIQVFCLLALIVGFLSFTSISRLRAVESVLVPFATGQGILWLLNKEKSWLQDISTTIQFVRSGWFLSSFSVLIILAVAIYGFTYPGFRTFSLHRSHYETVVAQIKVGKLGPKSNNVPYPKEEFLNITLPCRYEYLSPCGTRVRQGDNELTIRFCLYGSWDGSTEFVYQSDDQDLTRQQLTKIPGLSRSVKKLEAHWFYWEQYY